MQKIHLILLVILSITSNAQDVKEQKRLSNQEMREGNVLYQNTSFADAEVAYKKSIATYPENPKAIYNLANTMTQQKRYKEAIKQYDYLAKSSKSNKMRAQSYHNIGNSFMGLKKLQKAIDAYKNALRINPKDEETRYNLAYAQELLKQQQKQNKKDKNKNKKNKDKNKKDDKKKDDKEKDKNKKGEKDKKNDKEKDKKKNDKEDKGKKNQQPKAGKISPQQAKQLLKALENEEKKTQDKVNAKRVKAKTKTNVKDW